MNKLNNKKGISLIVLVITIIVMIILAAAIILSLQSSGIIGRANEAKTSSDIANKKQAATVALAEYELAKQMGETTKTATQYVQDKLNSQNLDGSDVAIDENNNIVIGAGASAIIKGVKLGDYVDYTPTAVTSTKYKTFDADEWVETDTYFATQTGENALKWRYMGIDDNGNILLIADRTTDDATYLPGLEGYLQGPNKLNDLCKELYSGKLGTARSINIEDVNSILGANPNPMYYIEDLEDYEEIPSGTTVGELASMYGEAELTNTKTPDPNDNDTWEDISKYKVTFYQYLGTKYKKETSDEYKIIFKSTNGDDLYYLLASTCIYAQFPYDILYEIRIVGGDEISSMYPWTSGGEDDAADGAVRPIVVLNSDVQFVEKSADGVWSIK